MYRKKKNNNNSSWIIIRIKSERVPRVLIYYTDGDDCSVATPIVTPTGFRVIYSNIEHFDAL